ncbi:MAG: DVUA0089 family protein [Pseudomonadota bacterium]
MTRAFGLLAGACVAALSAHPALAQAVCGNAAGISSQWSGGEEALSDISVAEFAQDLSLTIPPNSSQIVAFTLSQEGPVRIEAASLGEGDPVLDLVGVDGALLTSDDDGGGGLDSRIETTLPAGTYCAAIRGYDPGFFNITFRVGREDHPALTEGLTPGAACTAETEALALGDGALALPDGPVVSTATAVEVPFYRFTLDTPQAVSILAENESADPVLKLYDGNGVLLAENDDFIGVNARIDMVEPLAVGTYCIGIEALSDSYLPINTTLAAYSESAYLESLYAAGETAPPLDGSYPVEDLGELRGALQATVRQTGAIEWLSFSVPEESVVVVEGIGISGSDPFVKLFDEFGRVLGEDDDSGADFDALLPRRLNRGTYVLAVGRAGGAVGGPTRLIIERYVRAD